MSTADLPVQLDLVVGDAWYHFEFARPTLNDIIRTVANCYEAAYAQGGRAHRGLEPPKEAREVAKA